MTERNYCSGKNVIGEFLKLSQKKICLTLLIVVFLISLPTNTRAAMVLYFESSDQSWVGQGETVFATDGMGYTFKASRNYDNGASFRINGPSGWWDLDLAAPYEARIEIGTYNNAARFPFQSPDQPGLTFSGNGRGNNRNSGYFEVLEAVYSTTGTIESFAVDFTQYGEKNLDWWINGQLRYNSDVEYIPEPATIILLGIGGLAFMRRDHQTN